MNQDPLSIALTQIRHLVSTLNKKNSAQNTRQINQLVEEFGLEADRHYLRCLFSAIDFADATQLSKSASVQVKLLSNEFTQLLHKPSFVSIICFAFDNPIEPQKTLKPTPNLLSQIGKALQFSAIKDIILAYSLKYSQNQELVTLASEQFKACAINFIQSFTEVESNPEGGLGDVTPELLQILLSDGKVDRFGLPAEVYEKFIAQLCKDFPRDHVPLVLAPLLYVGETEVSVQRMSSNSQDILLSSVMETNWPKLVMDIGLSFTASVDECKSHLIKVSGRDIKPTDVAKVLTLMCQTHTSLPDSSINLPTPANFWSGDKDKNGTGAGVGGPNGPSTWKIDVFVQALKEVVPNLSWKEVCFALDHPEFLIKDRAGLSLLVSTVRLGYQSSGAGQGFPAECLYRHWENSEGQLSLIQQILKNSDIISFADHIFNGVPTDLLKTPPELDNKDVATWKSLHLVDVLLFIADHGYHGEVMEIFKVPLQHCPDLLFFALLQIPPPVTPIRHELFVALVPIFLGTHANSSVVIQQAWNCTTLANPLRHIIMNSMSDWYLRGDSDQARLSRILDVAQDLKALSTLLNSRSFMFVIDLACLASRREYLKLEKWIGDRLREHGDPFLQTLVKFLQRRCPQLMGNKLPDDQLPKVAQLPTETMAIILNNLQPFCGKMAPDLNEMIATMLANAALLLKSRQQQQAPPPNLLRQQGPPPGPQPQQQQQPPPPPPQQQFNAGSLGSQMFANQNVDAFTTAMNSLNLSASNASLVQAQFNLMNMSTPVSPSRLLGNPSHSPFSLMGGGGGGNPSVNSGGGAGAINNRMLPTPTSDRMASTLNLVFPDMTTITKEIEDEANSYFQRIYNHPPHPTLSIDEVLEMLQRFQESTSQREREVYKCMLRNLFEEYRFFPNYPDKELQITAQLFGGLIDRGLLLNPMTHVLAALRCVLESLGRREGTNMYFFGITALDRFKTKLHTYQKFCEYVRAIPHFDQFPPHLIEYIEYGCNAQEPPIKPLASAMPQMNPSTTASALYNRSNSVTSNLTTVANKQSAVPAQSAANSSNSIAQSRVKSIANATNIDTLLGATQEREEKIIAPPEAIQEKTAFIFNNLSQLNLQQKCEDIKEIMTKEYWSWMSQYLVLKRASIEFNFHLLYSNFLDVLKIPEINRMVTNETFRNIRVLLRSDKSIANFSDRSLLKNLGHWLGMMTLGRNRPILQLDIDLKSLIVEAYIKGQQELLYVVPFVAKVLEACAKSKVFKPPNPWTMAIMNVLAELHQEPDLKLNLKFEIEVLCKYLSIDVLDLKPVVYLKDPDKVVVEYQLSQPNRNQHQQPQQHIQQAKDQQAAAQMMANVGNMQILAASAGPPREDPIHAALNAVVSPSQGLDGSGLATGPPEPKFSYMDVNVASLSCISQLMTIPPNNPLLHNQPHLKSIVKMAIERTINEWVSPVVERSVKIAVQTAEQLVRKDFALDIDETHMRAAAQYMVRNLTAGMAMITCRDQLSQAITTNVKNGLLTSLTPQQKELGEATAMQVAVDNLELACAFIQKSAVERAIVDIDKRLVPDFELRKLARLENRTIIDSQVYNYQCERMPEMIRLTCNVSKNQFAVYEEFVKNIPGFLPASSREMAMFFPKPQQEVFQTLPSFMGQGSGTGTGGSGGAYTPNFVNADELMAMFEELGTKIEAFVMTILAIAGLQVQVKNMQTLFEVLINVRRARDNASMYTLVAKSVEFLFEGYVNLPDHMDHIKMYRDILLRVMRILSETHDFSLITKAVFECREEIRYNLEAIDILISSNLINTTNFDILLSQSMENGNNYAALNFAIKLVQHFLIEERPHAVVSEKDFAHTIDLLSRISQHHTAPKGLIHLIEVLRSYQQDPNMLAMVNQASHQLPPVVMPMRDHEDSAVQQKIEYLLTDWVSTFYTTAYARDPIKSFSGFMTKLNMCGILKTDEMISKFFHQATTNCIELTYRNLADQSISVALAKSKIFHYIDAYVRLVALLVKHSGDSNNPNTKINLLSKVLYIVQDILLQDQEKHGVAFQQLGYHRIFIMLFLELSAPDPILESISVNVVTAFSHTYHLTRPTLAPGFCYSWLELISHRVFLGRCLAGIVQTKGWSMYSELLMDLFKYLAPFLRNAELAKPVQLMYKGTTRVLLVLLHDFPEFLCDYHFGFCDVIPPNCIQMRNLILSAFPRNMRLPDPFTPNLKVDMLLETNTSPRIWTNFAAKITPQSFRLSLDSYLKARAPVTFLSELRTMLQVSDEPGLRYNIPMMNALVLYVGTQAITHIRSKNLSPNMNTIVHCAHMDIFQNLSVDLENEGRYLFLNAIANQLRYPNSHTNYFSCVLLYIFVEANSEAIQEQITRVLLERLIVNRPHPWGLLITFIELIKNPVYKFWEHDFVHCAPEIKKLFESVARSCMVRASNQQQMGNFEPEIQECN